MPILTTTPVKSNWSSRLDSCLYAPFNSDHCLSLTIDMWSNEQTCMDYHYMVIRVWVITYAVMSYLVQATLPCLVQGTLHYVISMIMTNLTIVLIEFSLVLWMINPQFFVDWCLKMIHPQFWGWSIHSSVNLPSFSFLPSFLIVNPLLNPSQWNPTFLKKNGSVLMLCSFLLWISILDKWNVISFVEDLFTKFSGWSILSSVEDQSLVLLVID